MTDQVAAPPPLVEREHAAGLHAGYQPRFCGVCWPHGAPSSPAAAPAPEPVAEAAIAPTRGPLPPRRRGEGAEPLRAVFERLRSRIVIVDEPEPGPDPSLGPWCETCRGARFVRRDVPLGHPDFGRAFPCAAEACAAWMQRQRLERFWRDVPPDVRDAALASGPRHAGQREAFDMLETWLTWPSFWLLLWGETGRGKTWLAVAAARALGLASDFVKVPDLLRRIQATYDQDERERNKVREMELLERLWSVPLLVLDDFGVEAPTAWAEERIYQVVDGRSTDPSLVTILTTNLPPGRLEARLAHADPHNGERALSRILGRCGPFVVEVGGPDLRVRSYVRSTLRQA